MQTTLGMRNALKRYIVTRKKVKKSPIPLLTNSPASLYLTAPFPLLLPSCMQRMQSYGLIDSLSGDTVRPELFDPGDLARSELVHAGTRMSMNQQLIHLAVETNYSLIRVVHEVVDWVDPRVGRAGASILSSRASVGTGSLSWSIGNPIVGYTATTLEGMEETEPVTNFVGCSLFKGQ